MVAAKAAAAWRSGLSTIVCIGESEVRRRNGDALAIVGDQVAGGVPRDQAIDDAESSDAVAGSPADKAAVPAAPTPKAAE